MVVARYLCPLVSDLESGANYVGCEIWSLLDLAKELVGRDCVQVGRESNFWAYSIRSRSCQAVY
jgi:hypothetical protein